MNSIKIKVKSDTGDRLDSFIALKEDSLSRSQAKKLIEDEYILVNGEKTKSSYKLQSGDLIEINIPQAKKIEIIPENIEIDIVYEDSDIAIINKPQDMVVHPAIDNTTGTLVNAMVYKFSELSTISGRIRPGIVHRLDKDTSGLLVIAKNDRSHMALSHDLKNRDVKRVYRALVHGRVKNDSGMVDAPIGRNPLNRTKMAVTEKNNREALTHYEVIDRYDGFTLLELRLESGRTHQIRVHMSHINHPLVGDPVYSTQRNQFGIKMQMLHAYKIGFKHPTSGEYMEFTQEPPDYFINVLHKLKKE